MKDYMDIAANEAKLGVANMDGGPFGAILVNKKTNEIIRGHNKVLRTNDPTMHAEVCVIRKACSKHNTIDLSDYVLYTTCEPCPMCLSAIIWANIKEVRYACTKQDANDIGFRDKKIYDYLANKNKLINQERIPNEECENIMKNYNNTIY